MLKDLRKSSTNIVMIIFFGAIIFVFAIGFNPATPGSSACSLGGGAHVATILGRKISREEFKEAATSFQRLTPAYQSSPLGLVVTRAMFQAGQQSPTQAALDLLVSREILKVAAEENGFTVSEDEIDNEILQPTLPGRQSFISDDQFDYEAFKDYVAYGVRISMQEYREDIARQLLAQKMAGFLTSHIKVSDQEIAWRYDLDETRVALEYIKVYVAPQREGISISDEEALAYAQEHAEEIETEFNSTQSEYGDQVKARHILFKVPPSASEPEKEAVKNEIDAIYEKLEQGEDFATLATENSQDPVSAANGGDLGWFGKGQMVPAFETVAFSIEPGKYSEPVLSPFGWHIILVEEKKSGSSLDDVKIDIAKKLAIEEKAKENAKAEAEALLAKAKTFSPETSLASLIPGAKNNDLDPLDPTEEAPNEEAPIEDTPSSQATSLPADDVAVDPYALKLETTVPFSRSQAYNSGSVPGIGLSEDLAQRAFSLEADSPVADTVFEIGDTYVLVRLVERTEPDMEKFAEEKERRRNQALTGKKFQFLNEWLSFKELEVEQNREVQFDPQKLDPTNVQ